MDRAAVRSLALLGVVTLVFSACGGQGSEPEDPNDQSELLALLGPDGGRGCEIPEDLQPTGEEFQGVASRYSDELAGEPTASGPPYDPELMTAAHRTLPLPSYLHVRHRDKCATVLVNDRGPYVEGRVLDLSAAAAVYLGVELADVEAEVLAPVDEPTPGALTARASRTS